MTVCDEEECECDDGTCSQEIEVDCPPQTCQQFGDMTGEDCACRLSCAGPNCSPKGRGLLFSHHPFCQSGGSCCCGPLSGGGQCASPPIAQSFVANDCKICTECNCQCPIVNANAFYYEVPERAEPIFEDFEDDKNSPSLTVSVSNSVIILFIVVIAILTITHMISYALKNNGQTDKMMDM
eukprot:227016_1